MKVLIITYYWPPAGGSGVQRWLKFVKYLQDFKITPIIFTVDDVQYPNEDFSLVDEIPDTIKVIKKPILEPTDLLFWKQKKKPKTTVSNATNNKLLAFVRGNFFIPDAKVLWVKPSVTFLRNFIQSQNIDVIITTGPPHSLHLIGHQLKQKTNVKWIADFRDPWSNLYYNKELKQLFFAKQKNKKLEAKVLQNTDCVITVSKTLQKEFAKTAQKVEVITNGFDDEVLTKNNSVLDKKFTIAYIGLLPKQSNPKLLFQVIEELCKENTKFTNDVRLNFVGDIANEVKLTIQQHNLEDITTFTGYVSHEKAIAIQKKSQVLLLLIPNVKNSEGILTGKLFEYITSKRPILAIGSEQGDVLEVLQKTNTGIVVNFDDKAKLKATILAHYHQYKKEELHVNPINIEQYHRRNLTKKLAEIIKNI